MGVWLLSFRLVLLALVGLAGAISLLHRFYFVTLPQRAVKKCKPTEKEKLLPYLERVAATPCLLGPSMKLPVHGMLSRIYLSLGRHAEAVEHCRAILSVLSHYPEKTLFAALEASTRRRLADSLEALGQLDKAAEEFRLAQEGVDEASSDTLRHLTEGKLLKRQNRHEEAYEAFLTALDFTEPDDTPVRVECMINLTLAAHEAGRLADCLAWAEQAIAAGATGRLLLSAHRMAGVACGNMVRLEESEGHFRQAYDLAAAEDNTPAMAQNLASLSNCLFEQGRLVEANETALKAAALDPKAARVSLSVQAQVLSIRGRYEEALAVYGRKRECEPLVIPASQRRIQAVSALDIARVEAKCGRLDAAWRRLEEARPVLCEDAKLGLKCESASCWLLAARGLTEESQRLAARVEARIAAFQEDPGTCRGAIYNLGMAACTRGDHDAGVNYWSCYLELSPHPVYQPTAFYYRGECLSQLGRLAEARDNYQAAVAMNIDTHDARLARRRLAEVGLWA